MKPEGAELVQAPLGPADRATLRAVARASIEHGLRTGRAALPPSQNQSPFLASHGASFVTLRTAGGALRGCIGSLKAWRPLAVDVADNAHGAAFRDPRFRPLTTGEWPGCTVKLSVLGEPTPMSVRDEADLCRQLVPGQDGVILTDGRRRSTFLPAVWESVPAPAEFVAQLKRKGRFGLDEWPATMRAFRYRVQSF